MRIFRQNLCISYVFTSAPDYKISLNYLETEQNNATLCANQVENFSIYFAPMNFYCLKGKLRVKTDNFYSF